jgi:hypothetical protein
MANEHDASGKRQAKAKDHPAREESGEGKEARRKRFSSFAPLR